MADLTLNTLRQANMARLPRTRRPARSQLQRRCPPPSRWLARGQGLRPSGTG